MVLQLVQLSDLHYGMLTENGKLSRVMERVNELKPDLIVITGDLVDEGVSHMEEMAQPLKLLKSRHGVLAVTGNHEYYAGVNRAVEIMKSAGIEVLRNEMKVLPSGLQILGVDDPTGSRRMGEPAADLEKQLSRLDREKPSILLYHQPIHFEMAASFGVGLQLSGHTHGGQLYPIIYISRMIYPRIPGLASDRGEQNVCQPGSRNLGPSHAPGLPAGDRPDHAAQTKVGGRVRGAGVQGQGAGCRVSGVGCGRAELGRSRETLDDRPFVGARGRVPVRRPEQKIDC